MDVSGAWRLACPNCGSTRVTRDREISVRAPYLRDGRVDWRDATRLRLTCRDPGCGKGGTLRAPLDVAAERGLRDHVAARVFALGQVGAASETGLNRRSVQRYVEEWGAQREPGVLDAAPSFVMLVPANLRGTESLLVIDADRESLVEILPTACLRGWLAQTGREPATLVCIPFDATVRAMASNVLPRAMTVVTPSGAARAARGAALRAIGALRRHPGLRGSNGMPRKSEFATAMVAPSDTSGWPWEALSLLAAARAALHLASLKGRAAGERAWPEFVLAASTPPAREILTLFDGWREQILEGLNHRFLDVIQGMAENVRRTLTARRPAIGYDDLRRCALLVGFELARDGTSGTVAHGTPIQGLAARLRRGQTLG